MLQALALSLTICAQSASPDPVGAFKALRIERPALFVAPELPDMDVAGLQGLPLDIPADGTCVTKTGAPLGEGAYLPRPWADTLRLQIERGEVYPARIQKRLDELGALALVALDAQGEAVSADAAAEATRVRVEGPSFWDYLPPVLGGVAFGMAVGFLGAVALSR